MPKVNNAYDPTGEPESWEGEMLVHESGRRPTDSAVIEGTVPPSGYPQLDRQENAELQTEAQAQSGGDRSPAKTSLQHKQDTNSKSTTSQPSPKLSNPQTRSDAGAAENRTGDGNAQGITAHSQDQEDQSQAKVVAHRNDANAGGSRIGSHRKAG